MGFVALASATITQLDYWRMGENDPSDAAGPAFTTTNFAGGPALVLANEPFYSTVSASSAIADTGSSSCIRFIRAHTEQLRFF